MFEWFDSVAGAYIWLRIFMLARDLEAKGWVPRMVYSGDISKENCCSVRLRTRRFLPSGFAIGVGRSEDLLVVPACRTTPSRSVNGPRFLRNAVHPRLGYLESMNRRQITVALSSAFTLSSC